ncbi:exported hypothetical protein [Burkholderia cepacia]
MRAAAVAAVTKAVTAAATVVAAAVVAANRWNAAVAAAVVPAARRVAVLAAARKAVRAHRQVAASTKWTTISRSDFPYPRNVKINPALWWGFLFVFAIPRIFLPRKTEAETRPAGTRGGLRTPEPDSWLDF